MRGRLIIATSLVLALLLPCAGWSQAPEEYPELDSQTTTRDFAGAQVVTTTAVRAGGNFEVGRRAYLQIDLDTVLSGAAGADMPRAVVINGFVSVALPDGLEPDGEPRLMYFDAAKGRWEFVYSGGYPQLERFTGLGPAIEEATSANPDRIQSGLAEIIRTLDPQITPTRPTDPRLTRDDASYAVTGAAWLIPCNVMFRELVGLFHPDSGLAPMARLRVNLPVKATQALSDPRIVIYASGLSAAVNQVELLPESIPATAIPLVPLDEAPVSGDAAGNGDTTEPSRPSGTGREGAGAQNGDSFEVERPRREADAEPAAEPAAETAAEAAATEPAEGETAEAPTAPPQPVPVLVYDYEWISWQTEVRLPVAGTPAVEPPEFTPPPATDNATPIAAPLEDDGGGETTAPPPGRFARTGGEEPLETAEPPATPETAPDEPVEFSQPVDTPGVRQVTPGTLPEVDQVYSVPLKPITGSGAGAAPANNGGFYANPPDGGQPTTPGGNLGGTYVPPVDLGEMILIPEGYFLMGTGGSASAGDTDEMPQTQVYLPDYYIDKYPVTNRQFHNFVISAGYKPEGNWMKYYEQGLADLPVRGVTWHDAEAYAKWAGKRLPSEAEWEKAARGEDGRTYPWGEDWSADILPRDENLGAIMRAEAAASPYGVMGMVGLVWQWTATPYHAYPFNADARGDEYVLRGGCYNNGRNIVRCANRYNEPPNLALNSFGFRCAKDAP
ncbi:SUMF1/EgtB/PvdO family nonheme iron enzyme [bacterium]|nr:SUMF1/EgtB/PvdO family nonheme iron enzyme [bacterium]